MLKGLKGGQIIAAAGIVIVALAGWIVVFTNQQQIDELQESLSLVGSERVAATEEIAELKSEVAALTEAAALLEEVELALDSYKTSVGSLEDVNAQIEDLAANLASLTPEFDVKTAELAALTEKVEALEVQAVVYEAFTGGGPLRFQTSGNVNVRTGPSTDSDVLVVLPPGTDVEVFEATEGGEWYKIGGVGYIFHDLVQPNPPAE